ncbi:hypothetical protein BKA70DRAFT_1427266 [Coprinopsis sp. MPI-PUGE-AT-0042]|nr:hypothetical protein BKA70DRAFT_1427266 [Coprinopsis sp. MPI-PUGE-AT-0042]
MARSWRVPLKARAGFSKVLIFWGSSNTVPTLWHSSKDGELRQKPRELQLAFIRQSPCLKRSDTSAKHIRLEKTRSRPQGKGRLSIENLIAITEPFKRPRRLHPACFSSPTFPLTMAPSVTTGPLSYLAMVGLNGASTSQTFAIPLAPNLRENDSSRQSLATLYGGTLLFHPSPVALDDVTVTDLDQPPVAVDAAGLLADPPPNTITEEDQPMPVADAASLPTDPTPTSTSSNAETRPSLEHIAYQVEVLTERIILVAIVQGQAGSSYEVNDSVDKALSQPAIIELLYQHYYPSGIAKAHVECQGRRYREWSKEFPMDVANQIRTRIFEPLAKRMWEEFLRPFLASVLQHTIDRIITSTTLFPDLEPVAFSPQQLRARLWWYANGGGYLHKFGVQGKGGVPYTEETEFLRHLPGRAAHSIAIALSNGSLTKEGGKPFVLHLRHGAVLQVYRFIVDNVARSDPTVLMANRDNAIEMAKLAAALLSAVLYVAWDRGRLDISPDDILEDDEAQNLLHRKLETLALAIESRQDFMPSREIDQLKNVYQAPIVELVDPLPHCRSLFLRLAIPQPSPSLRLYEGDVFVSYRESQLEAVRYDEARDDGSVEFTPTFESASQMFAQAGYH